MRFETLLTGLVVTTLQYGILAAGVSASAGRTVISDVQLSEHGQLIGQVCTAHGTHVPDVHVVLRYGGDTIAAVRADNHGKFAFSGVRGGVHEIVWSGRSRVVRLWLNDAAPLAAIPAVALTAGGPILRGQSPYVSPFDVPTAEMSSGPPPRSGHSVFAAGCGSTGCTTSAACGLPLAPTGPGPVCSSPVCPAPVGPGPGCTSTCCPPPAPRSPGMLNALALTTVGTSVAALAVSIDTRRSLDSAIASGAVTPASP